MHPRARHARGLPRARRRARGARASRSRSTSRSSARPTIRTCEEHPEWFRHRPDGSVQYAENPPKKYQDIYPFDFESTDWQALWEELPTCSRSGSAQGVRIFRVDNPHTKPFPFWEWAIAEVKRAHPDAIFLAEAFTRPKVMHRLAKLGFTQSYTYFTWRNTKRRADRVLHRARRSRRLASTSGRTAGRTRRTSCPRSCRSAAAPRSWRGWCWPRRWRANYGIYGPAFELLREPRRASRAARNTSTPRSTSCAHWDLGARRQPRAVHRPRQRGPPRAIRRCSATAACASSRSTTTS